MQLSLLTHLSEVRMFTIIGATLVVSAVIFYILKTVSDFSEKRRDVERSFFFPYLEIFRKKLKKSQKKMTERLDSPR